MQNRGGLFAGLVLILLGALFLFLNLAGWLLQWLDIGFDAWRLWPLILVLGGIAFYLPLIIWWDRRREIIGLVMPGTLLLANGLLLPLGVDQRPHIIPAHHALPQLAGRRFAAVLANDLDTLPFAFRLAVGAPVIWDAHEYYLDDQPPTWRWRLARLPHLRRIARRWIPRCRAVMTVSPGIAERYAREFGVRPVLVGNLPEAAALEPGQTPAPPHPVRLIHHGGMAASRSYATLIETATLLGDGYTLDLLVVPAPGHAWDELRRRTASAGNVRLLPPVPMPEIPARLNAAYDIGIHILPPASFNDRHALPNKLFEFIQARIAPAVWPAPEMGGLVREHLCGVVSDDFTIESMSRALNGLDAESLTALKLRAHEAAWKVAGERNRETFISVVQNLL